MNKRIYIIILLIILGVGIFLVFNLNKKQIAPENNNNNEIIVGGDRDEHGCIPSAGYSWCEIKNKCLRTWEESCQLEEIPNEKFEKDERIEKDNSSGLTQSSCQVMRGVWYSYNKTCELNHLSRGECISLGGEFNECNSACRHNPDAEICTMQCVLTCTLR